MQELSQAGQLSFIRMLWLMFTTNDEINIEDYKVAALALIARYKVKFDVAEASMMYPEKVSDEESARAYFFDKINSKYVSTIQRFHAIASEFFDFSGAINPNE